MAMKLGWAIPILLSLAGCAMTPQPALHPSSTPHGPLPVSAPSTQPFPRLETGMHTATIRRISVDAEERYLVSGSYDKTVRVWDVATGKLLQTLRPPLGEGDEGKVYAVAISPDGSTVAVGGFMGAQGSMTPIYLFDRASGQLTSRLPGLPNTTDHLAFSFDGHYLAVALGENGIRVYRTDDWREVARDTVCVDHSLSVEFSREGRMVTTCLDGYVRLYDAQFRLIAKEKPAGGQQPSSARFSPDGRQVAVGFHDTTAVNVLSAGSMLADNLTMT